MILMLLLEADHPSQLLTLKTLKQLKTAKPHKSKPLATLEQILTRIFLRERAV